MKRLTALWMTLVLLTLAWCGGNIFPSGLAASTDETLKEKSMQIGRIEGDIYSNSYAGIACALDSNWTYFSAEELQSLPDNVDELFADTDLGDAVKDVATLVDMQAQNPSELLSVNVVFTKLDLTQRLAYALLTEEQTLDTVLSQRDSLVAAYAQAGIQVSTMEIISVTFLGQPHYAIQTVSTVEGIPYYILQVMDYRLGGYGMTITAGSYLENHAQAVLDLFYTLE